MRPQEVDQSPFSWTKPTWTGTIDGQPRSGSGRGTNVLVNSAGTWQMLHEHLSA
ncbi:nuclear transport factor 2 family protein [Streptomyces sp. NBS 14/10]|uniref:nuclear transport factor 2 family protein n=1 Tax=Streptomyces sp. NBS 14/10 TaxID=1945643 RepID=UPI000B7E7470|nr:nuclear transport factor 2 family protein [Streptomyces sp. NBS 14/10]KAK1183485.1 nuclear transport factor 2 family protein [Streptomyces sp. NBS 14/10]